MKSDLQRKARLVAGGHKIYATRYTSYSSVMRMESMRKLNVIARAQGLQVLAGDVGNAHLNVETKRHLGLHPKRFDPNIWIKKRLDGSGYEYISTYVDDFLIMANKTGNICYQGH
jgi:hypothetical protein